MLPRGLRHLLARQPQHAVVRPHPRERRGRPRTTGRPRSRGGGRSGRGRRRARRTPARAASRPSPSTRCASRAARRPTARATHVSSSGFVRLPEREVDRVALVLARLDPRRRLAARRAAGPRARRSGRSCARRSRRRRRPRTRAPRRPAPRSARRSRRSSRSRAAPRRAGRSRAGRCRRCRRRAISAASSSERDAARPGGDVDLVVDVGDVLDQPHRLPAPLQVALHQAGTRRTGRALPTWMRP